MRVYIILIADVAGFEPTMRESKSRALPLGDTSMKHDSGFEPPTDAWKAPMLPLH